ncbi:hypothetical protein ScPMuIL_007384 [Solemya velum]
MFSVSVLLVGILVLIEGSALDRCPSHLHRNRYLKTYRNSCFEFVNIEVGWSEARDLCKSERGHLVVIPDQGTQDFIYRSLTRDLRWNRNGVWIGAHDLITEMEWYWITNRSVIWENFASDQPSCPWWSSCLEDCGNLRLDDGGRWHDYRCKLKYSYICQYAMLPPTTTTMTTTTTTTTTTTAEKTTGVVTRTNPTDARKTNPSEHDITKSPSLTLMQHEDEKLSAGALAGIIVAVILVFVAGIILGAIFCRRQRRSKCKDETLDTRNVDTSNASSKTETENLYAELNSSTSMQL